MEIHEEYRGCKIYKTPTGYRAMGTDCKTIEEARGIIDDSFTVFGKNFLS